MMTSSVGFNLMFNALVYKHVLVIGAQEKFIVIDNVRFAGSFEIIQSLRNRSNCLVACHKRDNCMSVNYETSTGTCELTELIPGMSPVEPDAFTGWQLIFTDLSDPVSMKGAVAWQSTIKYPASRGIDGNTNSHLFRGFSCFETYDTKPWWTVELLRVSRMESVTVYFRTDCCINRTRNRHFQVALTRAYHAAGIVTEVAYYEGPPSRAGENPLHIAFLKGTFGKVLKISKDIDERMHLCEIILKS